MAASGVAGAEPVSNFSTSTALVGLSPFPT